MFANALKLAASYTLPLIISKRLANGDVECGCATFIVVNPDGWILTAAHVLNDLHTLKRHKEEKGNYENARAAIGADKTISRGQRKRRLSKLEGTKNERWITNLSYWWGNDRMRVVNFKYDALTDLACGRIEEGFTPGSVETYPVFRRVDDALVVGTSLCRLGFPFSKITATFDESCNSFTLADGVLPMPRFPNDGIYTRMIRKPDKASKRVATFVETSTPGLRGAERRADYGRPRENLRFAE